MSTPDDRHGDADDDQLDRLHIDLPVLVADPAFIGQLATAARAPAPHRFARPAVRVAIASGAAALLLSGAAYAATRLTHPAELHAPVPAATPTATTREAHHAHEAPEAPLTSAHRVDRQAPRTDRDSPSTTPRSHGSQGDQNGNADRTARGHSNAGSNDQGTGGQGVSDKKSRDQNSGDQNGGDQGTGGQDGGDQNGGDRSTDSPSSNPSSGTQDNGGSGSGTQGDGG